jgi:hypothetical protein
LLLNSQSSLKYYTTVILYKNYAGYRFLNSKILYPA